MFSNIIDFVGSCKVRVGSEQLVLLHYIQYVIRRLNNNYIKQFKSINELIDYFNQSILELVTFKKAVNLAGELNNKLYIFNTGYEEDEPPYDDDDIEDTITNIDKTIKQITTLLDRLNKLNTDQIIELEKVMIEN